ncbi:MAG: GNAT family N-acetyltransferase [Balneolaceae bacterium]|nr:GNAT family N-acetyltransferase [Balneolaceae bacterium]
MNISIRRAELADLEALQSLFVDTIKSTCSGDYTSTQIEAWVSSADNKDRWFRLILKQFSIVATNEDAILGFAALDDGDYLDFMYVHKDYLRNGIASQLIDELKLESLRQGFYKLQSDVSITARPFFESKGFEVAKENRKSINGIELINYRMREA